jgi:hypothetical protein
MSPREAFRNNNPIPDNFKTLNELWDWHKPFKLKNERKTRANKVLPKAGLNGFDWTFVKGSTFVFRLNFCAKNSAFGKYPNRQAVKKLI